MHVVLGSGGVIARELSHALAGSGEPVRQVSRSPRAINSGDETFAADLTDAEATADAVAGARIAYLVAGLKYDTKVWAEAWPRIMANAIAACRRAGARLVFFDNVYAYGLVDGPMTETTPFNPSSRKGEIRARIATTLLDAMRAGEIEAAIVRAADFYGPGATSVPQITVIDRMKAGKRPQWVGKPALPHSLTFTPDAGRAVAAIAAHPDAWGETWHLPTSAEPMSGEAFVRIACELAGRPYRLQAAPRWLLRLMGVFEPTLRENDEMMYQFEHPYRFDSSKVETRLGLRPTPYREGIARCLEAAGIPLATRS